MIQLTTPRAFGALFSNNPPGPGVETPGFITLQLRCITYIDSTLPL